MIGQGTGCVGSICLAWDIYSIFSPLIGQTTARCRHREGRRIARANGLIRRIHCDPRSRQTAEGPS